MMKTAIVYYSHHHGNTKKLLDAVAKTGGVDLIDVSEADEIDFTEYDRVGLASGIYFSDYAKQITDFAQNNLPEGKEVFFIATCGASPNKKFFGGIKKITEAKGCKSLGEYICPGYDTYGPFKLIGGLKKGHPTEEEIREAVRFYKSLGE